MTRHLKLEGIDNLRDYGGYATACGRGLRTGRLYRSGHHNAATDQDLQSLARLGIAVVVDLRRAEERARQPSRRHPGFAGDVVVSDFGGPDESWEASLRGVEPTPELFHGRHLEWYAAAPFQQRFIDLFSRYFAKLAEADGAVLIHCAAGKDRTGLLAALTHHAAGVHRDDILADYLMTNELGIYEARAPLIAELIQDFSGHAPSDEAVRVAMGVRPEYLEGALAAIAERHGSVDVYLETVLGFDAGRRAGFEARLLG